MKKYFILLLLFCCTKIYADPIKHIIFFGDSLTDNGNLYNHVFKLMPKDPPYYQGRFSNGPTWAEYLGNDYYMRYKIDYDIYAVGGATILFHNPLKGCLPYVFKEEIDDYLLHTAFQDRSDTLFIIWMGANDYMSEIDQDPSALTDDIVKELSANIKVLIDNGGKHFALLDLPDLSRTPRALNDPVSKERLHVLSELHHEKVITAAHSFQSQYPDITFSFIDSYAIFNDLLTNTEKYNQKYHTHLNNMTESCWAGGYTIKKQDEDILKKELRYRYLSLGNKKVDAQALAHAILQSPALAEAYRVGQLQANGVKPCDNPDDYLFWDQIHPTRITHQIFANVVEELLTNDMSMQR
ncbi:MAG: hypothetical protein ACD_60C00149G0013 [uncultured bacterium]|nr:MAG: hypothetical protein ACD_60C00149G0013 [uncultured bacterium]